MLTSPGERGPGSINHDVITLLCSNPPRGELLCGERRAPSGHIPYLKSKGALGIFRAGPVAGARLHTTCEILHCALDKELIRGIREEMALPQSDAPSMRTVLYDIQATQLLMLLLEELESEGPSGKLYADSLIQALAIRVVLLGCKPSSEPRSHVSPLPKRVLLRVRDRIDAELAGDLSLSILAEESGYSRTHFQRMFRAATGLTPHQYLLERRLECAQELLEKRNADLIDIAAFCGFSSHSHMTTVFRRLLGMTPTEYRRNRQRCI